MTPIIRRLGPGDEAVLATLAIDDPDFDLAERDEPSQPLSKEQAAQYLANPAVLHWVAFEGERAIGHLYCFHLPLRSNEGSELILYDIGVRQNYRRQGIGRALMARMDEWMKTNSIRTVWVLADNSPAVEFYKACGFRAEAEQPTFMIRERD